MSTTSAITIKDGERSFSLIETVIALSIVTFLIIEVASVQGNSIVFSEYGRNITQASWLAKRVMAAVEYRASYVEFKELLSNEQGLTFEDFPEYQYSVDIREWKLSFTKILQMALSGGIGGGDEDKEDSSKNGEMGFIEQAVKQVFGDQPIFLTARVEVSWPEGATRNSTSLTNLFTNQKKLDEYLATLKPVWDQVTKPKAPAGTPPGATPPPPPGAATPGPGGATPIPPNGANPTPPPAGGDL